MRFKKGDKVKFLNENGGGIVKSVIGSKLVNIETDDGFEMPVLTTELIKDYRAEEPLQETMYKPQPMQPPQATEVEEEEDRISGINPWGTIKEEKGVYLAFEPHERQWILTGDVDVVLINHTPYDILYNLFLEQDGELTGVDFSSVPFESKIIIETIDRDDIENWTKGYLQVMFHKNQPDRVIFPIHTVIDIKPNRFFKEGSYRSSTLIQGRSILISIAPESTFETATFAETSRKSDKQGVAKTAAPLKEKALIDKHKNTFGEATVDLHIGELIDNILGLSSHDMFNIQIEYFKKTLESAIRNEYEKVTYIHGVGNGVLKNALVEELKNYENIENRMAAISKFGVGAIDVMIKNRD